MSGRFTAAYVQGLIDQARAAQSRVLQAVHPALRSQVLARIDGAATAAARGEVDPDEAEAFVLKAVRAGIDGGAL